jgi:hypothetical protein
LQGFAALHEEIGRGLKPLCKALAQPRFVVAAHLFRTNTEKPFKAAIAQHKLSVLIERDEGVLHRVG